MITKLFKYCFPFIIAAMFAVGCNHGGNQADNESTATNAKTATSDAEITAAVKAKFMSDKDVSARKIDVETNDGVVTLRGKVATATEAERAEELAKSAEGVRTVHSYLKTDISDNEDSNTDTTVSTTETAKDLEAKAKEGIHDVADAGSDAAITAQIKWKLAKDKMVQASDIEVDTKYRHVTLTGTVNSKQEKERAVQLARSVDDVVSVRSSLQIR